MDEGGAVSRTPLIAWYVNYPYEAAPITTEGYENLSNYSGVLYQDGHVDIPCDRCFENEQEWIRYGLEAAKVMCG
jgi:prepilin-type processing-associated H-X9-DG protein